ncbi:MAG: GyrI-like domain-containing protein [Chloroflexota bacterium]|nr:GyrI-like domain-containing protein [Chloroflexota bacterium]
MAGVSTLTDTAIVQREPEPTVAVRIQQPMDQLDLAGAFGRYLPMVASRVEAEGGTISGPSFGRYHRFGPDVVDVEIGFPVERPPEGLPALGTVEPGEVGVSELPGGPVARTIHLGPYDGLPAAYDALHEWIHAQPGYDDSVGAWESYVDDPGSTDDVATLRTEIVWPLVEE